MSKRIATTSGVIQREKRTSASGSGSAIARLLLHLAHARGAVRGVARALAGVDGAAGEHPGAAHEALRRVALDEQDLERLRAAPEHDHRRRLARLDRLAAVELGARLEAQATQSS